MMLNNCRPILAILLLFSLPLFSAKSFSETQDQIQNNCSLDFFQSGFPNVRFIASEWNSEPAHCRIEGAINERTSSIDSQHYAIGFEVRLPLDWNQRFVFQGNGGNDGRLVPATGASGNHPVTALDQGFAVLSTDAGHLAPSLLEGAAFGIDPQARLDYGYQANIELTPLAKRLISSYYEEEIEYSYFKGCSNGGRHAMVAASRLAGEFNGFIAGNPGFNLPRAAIQHAWDIQALSSLNDDITQSLSSDDLTILSDGVLAACDVLDGIEDGMVQAVVACQEEFNLETLSCKGNPPGKCLNDEKISVISKIFSGPVNSKGENLYSDWPYDAGVKGADWQKWKINSPIANLPRIATLGAGSLAFIFSTPPNNVDISPSGFLGFLREFNLDEDAGTIAITNEIYIESAMDFMTPPKVEELSGLVEQRGKLLVYHGASDAVFSVNDTIRWYKTLDGNHNGNAAEFARLFVVPGMNHCAGGPSTDQFDVLTTMVNWVEHDQAPDSIPATVHPENSELPELWSKQRSRPLCAFPTVSFYSGSGDIEYGSNFSCQ